MDTRCDDVDMSNTSAIDNVVSPEATAAAGATAAVVSSALTSTVGTVAAAAAASVAEARLRAEGPMFDQATHPNMDTAPKLPPPAAPAWDAHLENPVGVDADVAAMTQAVRRETLGIVSPNAVKLVEGVEFVSLGCFCAASNALQLLGLRKNSYPFDWVRSSLDGILHCLDARFEDFLTYSTYTAIGQYLVFGGTRWGGSFWHHNVEVPVTRTDMSRRVSRFYGCGNVPAYKPRLFVRVVNSTREIDAAIRLRDALRRSLPQAEEILLLMIVDLQSSPGPMAIAGQDGHGILFYGIPEAETQHALQQGAGSIQLTSENYARAIAFAVKYWAGDTDSEQVRIFQDARQLGTVVDQFDGGDPGRELFTPRKFYGQSLDGCLGDAQFQSLFARMRVQTVTLQEGTDLAVPLHLECFGKGLLIRLPPEARAGNMLQLLLHDGVLTACILSASGNQVAIASVEEIA